MRLYTASVGMAFMELILNRTGNAFTPLFHVALIIGILSLRKPPHRVAGLAAYCLWQITLYLLFTATEPSISELDILPRLLVEIVAPTALGMGISIDGGYAYVILGLIMWVCRKSRYRLAYGSRCSAVRYSYCSTMHRSRTASCRDSHRSISVFR